MAESVPPSPSPSRRPLAWLFDLLLILVLLAGLTLRLTGVNWDQDEHLHPDERFLTMVATDIQPVDSLGAYFDTAQSTLNPHNRGHGFYVYGTLPLFLTRYVGEALGQTGYGEIHLVGRQLSAVADVLTIVVVYLIAARLYDRRVGLLAAALYAFAVLAIQLSHFFAVDTFTTFFTFLALYAAVLVQEPTRQDGKARLGTRGWRNIAPFILFGVALGCAVASKISAAPLAVLLPAALVVRLSRQAAEDRQAQYGRAFASLVLAAVVSLLVFRVFQPYAFSGPGFFGVKPNPEWVADLRELRAQSTGDIDAPFALQWARRPKTFGFTNMVLWGLGLPLGVGAWLAFLWMGWRVWRGEWRPHLLVFGWTLAYFVWQSISFTSTMRYFLLIYPTLAIIAGWGIVRLADRAAGPNQRARWGWRAAAVLAGVVVLGGSAAYAFAFTRIYTRPITRVQASEWVYQNVPGPLNLRIATERQTLNQPLPYPNGARVAPGQPFRLAFTAMHDGLIQQVELPHVRSESQTGEVSGLVVTITGQDAPDVVLASAALYGAFDAQGQRLGPAYTVAFDLFASVQAGQRYFLTLALDQGQDALTVTGTPRLVYLVEDQAGPVRQTLLPPVSTITPTTPYLNTFSARQGGELTEITIPHLVDLSGTPGVKTLRLTVSAMEGEPLATAEATVSGEFSPSPGEPRGQGAAFRLSRPIALVERKPYTLAIEMVAGEGAVAPYGAWTAIEAPWDDPIPMSRGFYNAYDEGFGIYRGDLNFELYITDSPEKRERMLEILDQADTIFITSSRQWGSITRLPERFPMASEYYRRLVGCPVEADILWCFEVAEPGRFQGELGFELVQVFQSDPTLGPWRINDQAAEEAFTVYDHPKVFVFRKTDQYDSAAVRAALEAVDLSAVVHVTPGSAPARYSNLLLPAARWAEMQAQGTWSKLFDRTSPINQSDALAVVVWYLAVALLGWAAFPVVRLALPGLDDRGYPLARTAGLALLSYLVFLAGSLGLGATRLRIAQAAVLVLALGLALAYVQRAEIAAALRRRGRYYLAVEGLALLFFLIMLAVRLGNPDLWHPVKGGERPMELSYFQAILKSESFPPYDPWFAGGYINYYYYGYLLVGVLVKLLGILPTTAFNLILPTLFSLVALGGFSAAWNLYQAGRRPPLPATDHSAVLSPLADAPDASDPAEVPETAPSTLPQEPTADALAATLEQPPAVEAAWPAESGVLAPETVRQELRRPFLVGLAAAVGLVILGNLGTVRMVWHGLMRLAAPGPIEGANLLERVAWTVQGLIAYIGGAGLPYGRGDWYWIPSRAIPSPGEVEPITEFPAFSFLYSDVHAHVLGLPLTLLALAWAISVVLGRARWGEPSGRPEDAGAWRHGALSLVTSFLFGGLVIGMLRPTNTWDFPTYLLLAVIAVIYAVGRYFTAPEGQRWDDLRGWRGRLLAVAGAVGALVGLALLLFQPFSAWFVQAYSEVLPWEGQLTPFWSYLTHWGVFLFAIVSWLAWETHHWMATTPMHALRKLRPFRFTIQLALAVLALAGAWLLLRQVQVGWLALLLGAWAAVLIFRPGQPDAKRAALFFLGTGLVLTLFVELFVLRGDIARMNTVFKFYLQVWTLFAVTAAAGLGWLLDRLDHWEPRWFSAWQAALGALVGGALLFPLLAGSAKIQDRWIPDAPRALEGTAFMDYATYGEDWGEMDLSQDARAIRWLQQNVAGSPVIVEAQFPINYHWGNRMTIYTGLPGVIGWEWHQIQQRAALPQSVVTNRSMDVAEFYQTTDPEAAQAFLQKYNVGYIIVGQLERGMYAGPGLEKFTAQDGKLWNTVYEDGQTVIYQTDCGCTLDLPEE